MSLRRWALKPSELRPLSRGGLLLLAARCAMRVEPWRPSGLTREWRTGLAKVVAAASEAPLEWPVPRALAQRIWNAGATLCNRLDGTSREALGRCHHYASSTLSSALVATALDGTGLRGGVLEIAKLANSIPAVLAHDGQIRAPRGKSAVDHAAGLAWDATRRDVALLATRTERILSARSPITALRGLAPLWPGRAPAWTRGLYATR